jgi:hypothetical protein
MLVITCCGDACFHPGVSNTPCVCSSFCLICVFPACSGACVVSQEPPTFSNCCWGLRTGALSVTTAVLEPCQVWQRLSSNSRAAVGGWWLAPGARLLCRALLQVIQGRLHGGCSAAVVASGCRTFLQAPANFLQAGLAAILIKSMVQAPLRPRCHLEGPAQRQVGKHAAAIVAAATVVGRGVGRLQEDEGIIRQRQQRHQQLLSVKAGDVDVPRCAKQRPGGWSKSASCAANISSYGAASALAACLLTFAVAAVYRFAHCMLQVHCLKEKDLNYTDFCRGIKQAAPMYQRCPNGQLLRLSCCPALSSAYQACPLQGMD